MLILLQFSARKVILFEPQRAKIFNPLLEGFQEVLLDICGISFLLEYDFSVPKVFRRLWQYHMLHYVPFNQ